MNPAVAQRRLLGALVASMLVAPSGALADPPAGGGTGGAPAPEPVQPAPLSGTVSVSGPVTVTTSADTLLGSVATFRGAARARDHGKRVTIQRFDDRRTRWAVARTTVGPRGGFRARWKADHTGRVRVRALLRPRPVSQARARSRTRAMTTSTELAVTVY